MLGGLLLALVLFTSLTAPLALAAYEYGQVLRDLYTTDMQYVQ